MDELNMIGSLLDEGSPSDEVVQEGRERLRLARMAPRRRRAHVSLAGVGLSVAAAAAAVVLVAVVGVSRSSDTPAARPSSSSGPVTAQQILLTAATQAAQEVPGRYWHTHTITSQAYPIRGGYSILAARMEIDQWAATRPKDNDVFFSRFAGAVPVTAADRAAWQRAGSPSRWTVLSNGDHIPETSRSEAWQKTQNTPADRRELAKMEKDCTSKTCPPPTATSQQAQKVAGNPQELAKLLFPSSGKYQAAGDIMSAFSFLVGQPVPADVRAEVFRLLAKVPGVRSAGEVKDTSGRTAVALATPGRDVDTAVDTELLLDPTTYQILGTQDVVVKAGPSSKGMRPGSVFQNQVVVSLGWSNETPHQP
jgi:hypothetical protein